MATGADMALARITESLATAQADREAAEQASKGRTETLKEVRARVRALLGTWTGWSTPRTARRSPGPSSG